MASLDYALLAEYARIDQAGLLTVVGGGFDRINASGPTVHQLFVVVRVLLPEGETNVPFDVQVHTPESESAVTIAGLAARAPGAEPIDGVTNFTAALGMGLMLPAAGRYTVQVTLNGKVVRELPFIIAMPPQPGQ